MTSNFTLPYYPRVLGAPVPVVEKEEGKREKEKGSGWEEGRDASTFRAAIAVTAFSRLNEPERGKSAGISDSSAMSGA